jgi:TolA-binding protein
MMNYLRRTAFRGAPLWLLLVILACAFPSVTRAEENRLRRIQLTPHNGFTRINLFFEKSPDYRISVSPGRIRVTVSGADSPSFRRLRSYTDPQIAGLFCTMRYGALQVVIPVRDREPALQQVSWANPSVLTLEVGPALRRAKRPDTAPGRDPILSGTEQFVRDFQVPSRSGFPFVPTDVQLLKSLLPDADVQLFQRGEGLLYREQGSEAAEIFSSFLGKAPAVRALAFYRLGESLALADRNAEALSAFRQGEALWPSYLTQAPGTLLTYAEVRSRTGDFQGGRLLMTRLLDAYSGTVYAAPLMNRLAELWERHGERRVARTIYRAVIAHAPGSEAAARARLKLADGEMFSVPRDRYRALRARYQAIYNAPGDIAVRDEALFKTALLDGLYGAPREALEAAVRYDRCYPRGIFGTVVKKMREELLLPVYLEMYAAHDNAGLCRLALENREYLARCFADPQFAPRLADAFRGAAKLTQELELFRYLQDKSVAAGAAPFLAARVVEDALTLGNAALAESTGRSFLTRFPRDPRTGAVREALGRIAYEKGDLKGAAAELSFLNGKGVKPQHPESDYYLGKALVASGNQKGGERNLARFTASAPATSPLLPDGYFSVAGARVALKEYPAALDAYRQGEKIAKGETAEQFLYKRGELYLQLKDVRQAKEAWEKLAAAGGSGTWVKLASQALDDLKWRLKISGELP